VQPLVEPILAGEVEATLARWLETLATAGLEVDWACRDWTRHFRLPHVRRKGRLYRSPLLELERMRAIAIEVAVQPARQKPPTPASWPSRGACIRTSTSSRTRLRTGTRTVMSAGSPAGRSNSAPNLATE
jgi:hypothetical protein